MEILSHIGKFMAMAIAAGVIVFQLGCMAQGRESAPVAKQVPHSAKPGDADFPQRCGWGQPERHRLKVDKIKTEKYDLVLIGDSITQNLETGLDGESFAETWDKHYAPRKAINLGYAGQQTQHILWNLMNGELDFVQSPKVAILLIGTNNTDDEHFGSNTFNGEKTFNGIKAIVDLIRQRHPTTKIIIRRPYPCGVRGDQTPFHRKFVRSAASAAELKRAGDLASKLADNKHVYWSDVNKIFLRPDGKINTDLMPDLVHPNAAGSKLAAEALEPLLAKLMGDKLVHAARLK